MLDLSEAVAWVETLASFHNPCPQELQPLLLTLARSLPPPPARLLAGSPVLAYLSSGQHDQPRQPDILQLGLSPDQHLPYWALLPNVQVVDLSVGEDMDTAVMGTAGPSAVGGVQQGAPVEVGEAGGGPGGRAGGDGEEEGEREGEVEAVLRAAAAGGRSAWLRALRRRQEQQDPYLEV